MEANSFGLALGKAPATHDPRDLLMARYTVDVSLPLLPKHDLGHAAALKVPWGMLGNDSYGDCVFAGADHEHMLWNAAANHKVPGFSDETALGDYGAVTGFTPDDPNTDQGTNMRDAANYRRRTGVVDTAGKRHAIEAFVAVTPGDVTQIKMGVYLFGAVAAGIYFPDSAMRQFNRDEPWTVVKGASIEGGHYVPVVGYLVARDLFVCVTWGKLQLVAPSFLKKYMDEGYAYLEREYIKRTRSPEGFHFDQLNDDLSQLTGHGLAGE